MLFNEVVRKMDTLRINISILNCSESMVVWIFEVKECIQISGVV